jgi:2-polyprenyl-3-methyl-5-hydroxy-6-metoxy-1,4-benzoquinol methylase
MNNQIDWNMAYKSGDYQGSGDKSQVQRYVILAGALNSLDTASSVLDIGCGNGLLRQFLSGPTLNTYTGIDISQAAIDSIKLKHPNDHYICSGADEWNPKTTFDAIVFNEVLYYLPNPRKTIEKYKRFLRPGGMLLFSIYNKRTLFWQKNPNRVALRAVRSIKRELLQSVELHLVYNSNEWNLLWGMCPSPHFGER